MFRNLFKPDSFLMILLSRITDSIFLSLFWLLCCFPVLTVGTSFAALYDASYRTFRKGERNSWQRFFRTFRENWKAGILPTVVFLALFGLLGWGMIQLWNGAVGQQISWLMFAAVALVGILVMGVLSVLFPVLSRFENKFGALLKNTLLLSLANLPRTLCLGLINTLVLFLCVRFVVPVFILPCLAAVADSFLLEPMFRPYLPAEETEETAGEDQPEAEEKEEEAT